MVWDKSKIEIKTDIFISEVVWFQTDSKFIFEEMSGNEGFLLKGN